MKVQIENEFLIAQVDTLGAELCSLRRKEDGAELIWQGDARYWSGHAPTLFPITGKLRDLRFEWEGKSYEMPPHGFAKDREFHVRHSAPDRVEMTLEANGETLRQYPFLFCFSCTFLLFEGGISIVRQVRNTGDKTMYFSMGEHLGLSLAPWADTLESCELVFPAPQTAENWRLDKGLLTEKEPFLNGAQTMSLSKEAFREYGCFVLQGLSAPWAALRRRGAKKGVRVSIGGFPAVVVWSPDNEGAFVCVEPWQGLPSKARGGYNLADRPCILSLPAGESYEYTVTVEPE